MIVPGFGPRVEAPLSGRGHTRRTHVRRSTQDHDDACCYRRRNVPSVVYRIDAPYQRRVARGMRTTNTPAVREPHRAGSGGAR
jgi:hypothetical protein